MSDSNQNDPLEKFFQKKAGEYNISYQEKDWRSLEKRLDAVDTQHAARRKRYIAAAVILIAFSAMAYFTYQNQQQIDSLNKQLAQTEELSNPPANNHNRETGQKEPGTPKKGEEQLDESSNISSPNDQKVSVTESIPGQNTVNKKSSPSVERSALDHLAVNSVDCLNCPLTDYHMRFMVDQSGIAPVQLQKSARKEATEKRKTDITLSQSPDLATDDGPRASIGLVAGPDLSTVGGLSNFYDPGFKIGFTFDYNINENFAISVGAIRSNVRYTAEGQEYTPPKGYWDYGIQASQAYGQCILIDIPLNLTYRFMHFDHSRLYASAGMSSYIMISEDYQFQYATNQPGLPRGWKAETGTKHYFSNASFSVGYEVDISRNLSIRAEPFLRIPVKEVGWGNVNLFSVGSLVSLNYQLY